MLSARIKAALAVIAAYVAWKYYGQVRQMHDVRSYQETEIPHAPAISTARLSEFEQYDRWTHGNAIAAIKEFSRLYQESFLGDADAANVLCRMQTMRAKTTKELYGLKMWIPNDVHQHRRILAAIEEIDAMMAATLREASERRGIRGIEPHAGRLRPQDDLGGVRPADDTWDF